MPMNQFHESKPRAQSISSISMKLCLYVAYEAIKKCIGTSKIYRKWVKIETNEINL
jgi:hypothetical protein